MDIRERFEHMEEIIRAAIEARQLEMWTALPGVVEAVNFEKQTMTVRPSVKGAIRKPDGSIEHVDMPLLQDVPMQFPSGGGTAMTFPVKKGDETLVVFSSRSIDAQHQSGGAQQQMDGRMHSLSDGHALLGFRSNPRALKNVSGDAVQLRSEDGKAAISLNPGSGTLTMAVEGVSMKMTAAGVEFTGGTIKHDGKNIGSTHIHGGVVTGGDTTTGPAN